MAQKAQTEKLKARRVVFLVLFIGALLCLSAIFCLHPGGNAQYYMRDGRFKAALKVYEKPVDNPIYASDPFFYLDYAICLKRLGRYEDSLNQLKLADKTGSRHPVYSQFLSLLYSRQLDFSIQLERGWNYYHMKQYGEAESAFQKAIELNKSSARPYSGLAAVYDDLQEPDACEKAYQKGIDLSSGQDRERILHDRGKYFRMHGKLDKAVEDMTAAIKCYRCAFAFYDRGLLYMRKGKLDRALADLNAAIRIVPREKFYHERALLKKRMNDLSGALQDIKRAERLNESCQSLVKDKEEINNLIGEKGKTR